jgi:peptidoglycan/LPS O-acetylase OafA/YrhL
MSALRFAPPSAMAAPGRDLGLDGLRGLCALLVAYGHVSYFAPVLDPVYALDALYLDFGPPSVLIFLCSPAM